MDTRSTSQRSLVRQLLLWLLLPLAALLALNGFFSYRTALDGANEAFDRLLLASVRAIADRVGVVDEEIRVDVPYVALELFESKSQERIFYRVATASGETVTGYEDLPLPPRKPATLDDPVFYNATYRDETVYFAALQKPLYDVKNRGPAVIVVGQTAESRDALSRDILVDSLARQGLLIAVAALVVWLGLHRGLRPVLRLSHDIAQRAPTDLTPIDDRNLQAEVRPLIDAINQHTERLDKLIAARQRFLDDASHQLRTPLAALKTQAEFGLSGAGGSQDANRALLADIHRTTDETIRLVNQLLALARAEPQGMPSRDMTSVDLDELARATTTELVPVARQKRIDLGYEGGDESVGSARSVRGNRLLLHELIVNLVDNAIRYTHHGGRITVRVVNGGARNDVGDRHRGDREHAGDAVVLEVEDDGPGIPAAERERVFERFYRGAGTTESGPSGSGLGLAIVEDICRSHGASIELCDAQEGRGLRVRVAFDGFRRTD